MLYVILMKSFWDYNGSKSSALLVAFISILTFSLIASSFIQVSFTQTETCDPSVTSCEPNQAPEETCDPSVTSCESATTENNSVPLNPGCDTSAQSCSPINIQYDVPLVPQMTNMSCWAAGAAMLVGWKDKVSIDPSEIANAIGYWKQYQNGLAPSDTSMFNYWGLIPEPPQSYTVEGFANLLQRYGPLWVASAEPGPHIRVVTGMTGDGTPDGTTLFINDPWQTGMKVFSLPNSGSQYSETYNQFVQKQDTLAISELSTPNAIYVAHLP
jgi:Papain-like cysteine protease AvrRpt2